MNIADLSPDERRLLEQLQKAAWKGDTAELERGLATHPHLARSSWSAEGFTLLHEAANGGRLNAITTLLRCGAKATDATRGGCTPLHSAAASSQGDHPEIATTLINSGASVNAADADGNTPLGQASNDKPRLLAVLLRSGADPNVRNKWGITPLSRALQCGNTDIANQLRAAGAKE